MRRGRGGAGRRRVERRKRREGGKGEGRRVGRAMVRGGREGKVKRGERKE